MFRKGSKAAADQSVAETLWKAYYAAAKTKRRIRTVRNKHVKTIESLKLERAMAYCRRVHGVTRCPRAKVGEDRKVEWFLNEVDKHECTEKRTIKAEVDNEHELEALVRGVKCFRGGKGYRPREATIEKLTLLFSKYKTHDRYDEVLGLISCVLKPQTRNNLKRDNAIVVD